MSSLLRRLRKAEARDPNAKARRIAQQKAERVQAMLAKAPPLPFGVQQADYVKALAHMRRTFPDHSGRELHELAVEACVEFTKEQQVQRVLAGRGKA
jgi:uncharacterized short protein YbdD (DUF466 family)